MGDIIDILFGSSSKKSSILLIIDSISKINFKENTDKRYRQTGYTAANALLPSSGGIAIKNLR